MNIILFDDPDLRRSLMPMTYTRPVAGMRCGILTIGEKWSKRTGADTSFLTERHLSALFPLTLSEDNLLVNGALCPDEKILEATLGLKSGEALVDGKTVLAFRTENQQVGSFDGKHLPETATKVPYTDPYRLIRTPWDIFTHNREQINADFAVVTAGRKSQGVNDPHTIVYGEENLFVEEGAKIRSAIINAEDGPVYIGKRAEVEEGTIIRGPFAMCEDAKVHMGSKMRADTTLGPYSKVGGEVSNCVIFGYSSKAHDGFLGNSVLGEWCNLGADTNNSNLKNNYANVKMWNYGKETFVDSGLQFCGLVMGDHAKAGINTMFNTGTVVGVSANIFGAGFPRNFVPSFSWGGHGGYSTYKLDKMLEVARMVMARRNKELTPAMAEMLKHVFQETSKFRVWDNHLANYFAKG
ncbi:glucose-1-phosphate thymidylyltransferase [Fulvitalea axinellae]|uniref:Glucose-1-phosphate thymidylyltransferase n=1 Tax=Fulvitalea axinellae TaxID=1182444 RepID=A0AAU9DBL4_9BACT|nr:glucose-1-phosphate thymidylyltransferase [Fulvitalea axinellae]